MYKFGTVTITRLIDESFETYNWIRAVLSSILVRTSHVNILIILKVNSMHVRIGCSFLCRNKDDEIFYVYAAPGLAPYSMKTSTASDVETFIESFRNISRHELMTKSNENDDNVFFSSNINPYKLVCLYIWVTK